MEESCLQVIHQVADVSLDPMEITCYWLTTALSKCINIGQKCVKICKSVLIYAKMCTENLFVLSLSSSYPGGCYNDHH